MHRVWLGLGLASFLGLLGPGCGGGDVVTSGEVGGAGGGSGLGRGIGEACTDTECRVGLVCDNGSCQPGHSQGQNQSCVIAQECQAMLQCVAGTCQPAGSGASGDGCRSDAECSTGLRCALIGFSAQCAPEGSGDVGASCTSSNDCYAGLACAVGTCTIPPPGTPGFGIPLFNGVDCEAPSSGEVNAFFEVPGATSPAGMEGDFFRLPFPNDVRRIGGKLDLTGFPTPGGDLLGFDPVQRYLDVLADQDGWGTNPSVLFRFSGEIDFDSIRAQGAVNWFDVTPQAPEYGRGSGLYWYYSSGRGKYICNNWLGIQRGVGEALLPGHTYAIWISGAKDKSGNPVKRSTHLTVALGDTTPSDAKLAAAHSAFKPLRDYLKDKNISPDTLLNASVITVANVLDPMAGLAAAVESAPAPATSAWVKCGGSQASPCPQAEGDRACGSGDPAYDEYHALVSLPIFQQGSAPYLDPADGGGLSATPVRSEEVCMALTVPKSAAPAGGFPLVVFAHGTGGSFRSHVRGEIAGALSSVSLGSASVSFAVLGIDQVQHGPRRGSSSESPNLLFFNFANPAAARGNPLQGAADQLALARLVQNLVVPASATGSGDISIDPSKVVFFGHSQGSTEGSLALPFSDVYTAALLSGNGASLKHALLEKTQPVNIQAALPLVLADAEGGELHGGEMHPVLTMLAQWIDPADPLNFARLTAREPLSGINPKHVFQTYGQGDNFSPPLTMQYYAVAAGLGEAPKDASVSAADMLGLSQVQAPAEGNLMVGGTPVSALLKQYAPAAANDGHFVVFDVASANQDALRFLAMAVNGDLPRVGN